MVFYSFCTDSDSILYGSWRTGTVSDDYYSIHSEQRTASVAFIVSSFLGGFEGAFGDEPAYLADGIGHDFLPQPLGNGLGSRFAGFEQDIANKSITDYHIELGIKKVVPFDVTDEVQVRIFQQLENFAGEIGSLGVFFTNRHESYARLVFTLNVAGVNRAHDPITEQMRGFGFDISARVNDVAGPMFVGNRGSDAGALNAGNGA